MIIFPAIDMRHGQCVRLQQGRADAQTVYFADPVATALHWEMQGAAWLHLVDLDGAMSAESGNREIARRIFSALSIPVQFGGGVRNLDTLSELIEGGASRIILGTAAVSDPMFLEAALHRYEDRIVIGLDAKQGRVATRGWNQVESIDALAFAKDLGQRGVRRVIFTDISRDGMLTGPNLEATRRIIVESGLCVIASGGVSSLEDLRQLKQLESLGLEGVIVGKALYEKKFTLSEALEIA
jgi:phosphoribosylformimino-5-aminoimidazole carboxamide ribotide isomerase